MLVEKGGEISRSMAMEIEDAGVEAVFVYSKTEGKEDVVTKVIGNNFVDPAKYVDIDLTRRPFRYEHYKYLLDHPDSRIIDKITCFCQASDGTLWLGSNGYGLYRRNVDEKGHETFTVYTMKNGLPNNAVKGIVEDKHGKLWLTTDNGLSHFDPETGICYNYYKSDGLISNQFYWNSAVKAPNGRILLGGTEGLTVLLGDNSKALHKGHLRFTSLMVANQTVHADGHYMDKDISITDNIRLHESDKSFEISFSALNYGPETQGV